MDSIHIAVKGATSFALLSNSGPINISTFYDGKTCTHYYAKGNQFTRNEFVPPYKNLDETASGFLTSSAGFAPSFVLSSLFKHSPLYFLSDGFVTQSSYLGVEKIGDLECHRIRLCDHASPLFMDMWIMNGNTPFLMQSQTSEKVPSAYGLANISKYTNWKFNAPIASDVFVFHPPANAKFVSKFQ